MNTNIQFIVVHSTQTRLDEPHHEFPFHYIIERNGNLGIGKKISSDEKAIHVAYVGGLNDEKNVKDTRTEEQCEFLFYFLFLLTLSYPEARIFSASQIFGELNDPGFKIADWLKSYMPKAFQTAA